MNIDLNEIDVICGPAQPLLIHIATIRKKGCNSFYKILRTTKIKEINIKKREKIWEEKLATTLSINFWQEV